MQEKVLMLGNEAIARGAYEAGCMVVSSYPGTPSTEITEYIALYDEIYSEWAPNEKVAFEVALGSCIAGGRALCAMKHVGLNVAADPLFTAAYTGVNAGLVICVADDPGMHSSQNEQDSRHYANASKTLMLEPSDSMECLEFTRLAFALSEEFDTPVIIRLSTRIAHSQSLVTISDRTQELKPYEKNHMKYVMMPGMARLRHVVVEERINKLIDLAEKTEINRIEYYSKKIGVITSGTSYNYAKEALGENASYLKLGMVYPLPVELIKDFAANVDKLYIIEELDPIFESHCRNIGINGIGKEVFSLLGEYSANIIREKILDEKISYKKPEEALPPRPPVMCAGCPHRGTFSALNKLGVVVSGDIGCYTLGALAPLNALDTTICMGASIGVSHGMEKARGREFAKKTVAVIGDSTFMHTGLNGLVNVVYNKGTSVTLILDNSITGMTGHQQNPTTGYTLKGEPTNIINLELLCKSLGINRVHVADPFKQAELAALVKAELEADEPSVIIVRRPCVLLKSFVSEGKNCIDHKNCKNCSLCIKTGCPAIMRNDGKIFIDQSMCVGCGYCKSLCKFGAITETVSFEQNSEAGVKNE